MRRAIYEHDVIELLDKGWKLGVYGKIARLCFYLNEDAEGLDSDAKDSMLAQIGAMYGYQDKLERRIRKGWY